jgi:putative glutathione S-transferase
MDRRHTDVNNRVYRYGFARSSEAYERAIDDLFGTREGRSDPLTTQRLTGGRIDHRANVRLFTTLVRFDAMYHVTSMQCA